MVPQSNSASVLSSVALATGEEPLFQSGERVRVMNRAPVGHYRVPNYLRGKTGTIETVIEPMAVDNEEEAYGRNAGSKRHYYRLSVPMTELWPSYIASPHDTLQIEVFETWLERL